MPSPCLYCRQPLMFITGKGYLHPGGLYVQWCPDCHQEFTVGPSPAVRCPYCGGRQVRDRHVARPDLSSR